MVQIGGAGDVRRIILAEVAVAVAGEAAVVVMVAAEVDADADADEGGVEAVEGGVEGEAGGRGRLRTGSKSDTHTSSRSRIRVSHGTLGNRSS